MQYKKFGDLYFIRIDKGEEVIEKLREFGRLSGVKTGSIQGIGASDRITVGVFDLENKTYSQRVYMGQMEITSLIGSITEADGEPYIHLHINFAGEDMLALGGHLNECVISGTCEIALNAIDGVIGRVKDDNTGLNVFDLE